MIQRTGPRPGGEAAEGRAYILNFDATLVAGERRRVVNTPTVVAFRATRLVLPTDMDVDVFVVHDLFTDGKSEHRHVKLPCSMGNLVARLPVGPVILSRCEIGGEIGFEVENKSDRKQRFAVSLIGEGFKPKP